MPDAPANSGSEITAPLWTPEELASITSGTWLRPPGPEWNPVNVRGVCLPVPAAKHAPINRAWLPGSIMIVGREAALQNWFSKERRPAEPPTGCVIVGQDLATSPALPKHRAVLVAPSCSHAMNALVMHARERLRRKLVAITGTVGKTTTTGMLAHALGRYGVVHRNVGNNNLRTHVLQYAASIRRDTDFAIFEMGLGYDTERAFGELSAIVQPDLVIITQLDLHHLDAIAEKDISDHQKLAIIADRKLQLAEGLRPGGAVLINSGAPFFEETRARLRREGKRVLTFGAAAGSDSRLLSADSHGPAISVVAEVAGRKVEYVLPIPGSFMAINSLAVLAAAQELGINPVEAAEALTSFEAVKGRAKISNLNINGKQVTLIDDSANATPLSMRGTFKILQGFNPPQGGRRIAVLGDINHWEEKSAALHAGLAEDARAHDIDKVYTTGIETKALQAALPTEMAAGHFKSKSALVEALVSSLRPGDVISVKASANQGFFRIVRMLKDAAAGDSVEGPSSPFQSAHRSQ